MRTGKLESGYLIMNRSGSVQTKVLGMTSEEVKLEKIATEILKSDAYKNRPPVKTCSRCRVKMDLDDKYKTCERCRLRRVGR
ncbi:MAG: hypothetical protein DRJ03_04715 [Chloroflexi bacterium]|nr:MAG: hypothetical protein DRJ03_04715 [Chloroflexota bacterium]